MEFYGDKNIEKKKNILRNTRAKEYIVQLGPAGPLSSSLGPKAEHCIYCVAHPVPTTTTHQIFFERFQA